MTLFTTAVIGSLPRPKYILDLLLHNGELQTLSAKQECLLEGAIRSAVSLQEQAGIDLITDGEWRRITFFDILAQIADGFRLMEDPLTKHLRTFTVVDRIRPRSSGFLAREVQFLRSITSRSIKVTLPSPALLGERMWHAQHSRDAYPDREAFVAACIPLLRKELVGI